MNPDDHISQVMIDGRWFIVCELCSVILVDAGKHFAAVH